MPLYEYECSVCRHRFELLQKFSDEPATSCHECGGPVTRLVSAAAIQFKGTGWYVTDYARKGVASSEKEKDGKDGSATEKTASTAKDAGSDKGASTSATSPAAKVSQ